MQQQNEQVLHYPPFIGLSSEQQTSREQRIILAKAAIAATKCMVRNGISPSPRLLVCSDCGAPADHYDHRDYLRPIEVDPVCSRCNNRRGPAKPFAPRKKAIPEPLPIDIAAKTAAHLKNSMILKEFYESLDSGKKRCLQQNVFYFTAAYQNAEAMTNWRLWLKTGTLKLPPEAQAKITAAAREGTKRYWARIKAEKDHGNL